MNLEILKNLIELNADEWNSALSEQLSMPVDMLKNTFNMRQSLSMTENKVKLSINNEHLHKIADESVKEYESKIKWFSENPDEKFKYIPPHDRFVNKVSDELEYQVNSFSCVGKIIMGIDFTRCAFNRSFFNGCIFFNCVFDSVSLDQSVFLNCTFNVCDLSNSDGQGVQFSRCKFIDTSFDRAEYDKSIITDSIFIACQFISAKFMYSTIAFCGFNECTGHQSDFRNSKISVSSMISCNLTDANFRNSNWMDLALLRCDFEGSDLLGVEYISITAQEINYAGEYGEVFEISRDAFSPAVREWSSDELYDENEVDYFLSSLDREFGGDDDDDDDEDEDDDSEIEF